MLESVCDACCDSLEELNFSVTADKTQSSMFVVRSFVNVDVTSSPVTNEGFAHLKKVKNLRFEASTEPKKVTDFIVQALID